MQGRIQAISDKHTRVGLSTHDATVQASAAHMLLQLRIDFTEGKECDLTPVEYAFIQSGALDALTPTTSVPAEWDEAYPNIRGIFAFLRAIFTYTLLTESDYQIISNNIKRLIAMRKDHWSIKTYYENGVKTDMQPTMGEVLNLTCLGLMNDGAFKYGKLSIEAEREYRLNSLYQTLLHLEAICSTGLSNNFLSLLNGYKGIYIVEFILGFLHDHTLKFVTATLLDEFKKEPEKLYQLILSNFNPSPNAYEGWLLAHAADLEAHLTACYTSSKLDPDESKRETQGIIAAITDLDIPADLNPAIIIMLKYLLRDFQNEKNELSSAVITAITIVGQQIRTAPTLDALPQEPLEHFMRVITLSKQCQQYNHSKYFLIGQEGGDLLKAVEEAEARLASYFESIKSEHFDYRSLMLNEALAACSSKLTSAIRQYNTSSNEPFVRDFFSLYEAEQRTYNEQPLCDKMDLLRQQLQLSDADIEAYYYQNLHIGFNEVAITPFEMNRFILHALWVAPAEWSNSFRVAFSRVIAWFYHKKDHNQLENAFKRMYENTRVMHSLNLLALFTSEDAPTATRQFFEAKYQKYTTLYQRLETLAGIHISYISHISLYADYIVSDTFLLTLLTINPGEHILIKIFNTCRTNLPHRQLILETLLEEYASALAHRVSGTPTSIFDLLDMVKENPEERRFVLAFIRVHARAIADVPGSLSNLRGYVNFRTSSFSDKEALLLEFAKSERLFDLAAIRGLFPKNHPQRETLTAKIKVLTEQENALNAQEYCDLLLYYHNNVAELSEILTLLKENIAALFINEEMVLSEFDRNIFLDKALFYRIIFSGDITRFIKSSFSLRILSEKHKVLAPLIEEDIFIELRKPNDPNNVFYWNLVITLDILSAAGKIELLTRLSRGEFGDKLEITPQAIVRSIQTKDITQAVAFLKACPSSFAKRLFEYALAQFNVALDPSLTPEAQFATNFLSFHFRARFKSSDHDIREITIDPAFINLLSILFHYLQPTFDLSDKDIDQFLQAHTESINESEINRFVMHALSVSPKAWSAKFKKAFAQVVQTLKQSLNAPDESALNAPFCIPEFVYNLSAAFAFAKVCKDIPEKAADYYRLFQPTVAFDYLDDDRLYKASYLIKIINSVTVYMPANQCDYYKKMFLTAVSSELAFHIRSTHDVRVLLSFPHLEREQYNHIYNTAVTLLEKNQLSFDAYENIINYATPGSPYQPAVAAQLLAQFQIVVTGCFYPAQKVHPTNNFVYKNKVCSYTPSLFHAVTRARAPLTNPETHVLPFTHPRTPT